MGVYGSEAYGGGTLKAQEGNKGESWDILIPSMR